MVLLAWLRCKTCQQQRTCSLLVAESQPEQLPSRQDSGLRLCEHRKPDWQVWYQQSMVEAQACKPPACIPQST